MYEKVKNYHAQPLIRSDEFLLIAGPCAVEEEASMLKIAQFLLDQGVHYLRAGAYKPRTSPYTFQGLENEGLQILKRVKEQSGIRIVCEITDVNQLPFFETYVDIIQVGARNMQNFVLLKALGKTQKPIMIKRGFGATIEEWLYACEYVLNEGNTHIILCERGIKTFERMTRNTLDISSVPLIKNITTIPVLIDPSHSAGRSDIILPLARAGIAVGADGLMVEVHYDPVSSLSDKEETINFIQFTQMMKEISALASLMGKKIV